MTEKSIGRLMKASDFAANEQMQHLVIMLAEDGQFVVTGSANFIEAVKNTDELVTMKTMLMENKQAEGIILPSQLVDFPLLPCPPFSPAWKGAGMIRSILTRMLSRIGYGDSGRSKKMGVGMSPLGWREDIMTWEAFSGVTRSGLSVNDISEIIISMLQAAGVDPQTHVQVQDIQPENQDMLPDNQDQALQPQEQALQPQEQALLPQDQALQQQDQALLAQDQALLAQDQALLAQDQALQPQEQALQPQDQALQPQDQALLAQDQDLQPQDQALQPQDQALKPEKHSLQDLQAEDDISEAVDQEYQEYQPSLFPEKQLVDYPPPFAQEKMGRSQEGHHAKDVPVVGDKLEYHAGDVPVSHDKQGHHASDLAVPGIDQGHLAGELVAVHEQHHRAVDVLVLGHEPEHQAGDGPVVGHQQGHGHGSNVLTELDEEEIWRLPVELIEVGPNILEASIFINDEVCEVNDEQNDHSIMKKRKFGN